MKKITRRLIITLGVAVIVLALGSVASAQETSPNQDNSQNQTEARKGTCDGQGQAQGAQKQTGSARKLGPGDGTGITPFEWPAMGSPDCV